MINMIKNIDDYIVDNMPKIHTKGLIITMRIFTQLGNQAKVWFAMCIPLLIIKSTRLLACTVLLAMLITVITGEGIIKHCVCRVRPCSAIEEEKHVVKKPTTIYSFPSGHSASSFTVCTVLIMNRMWPLAIPAVIIGLLIAFSRLYLLVHYLTDVIVGIILGVLCGFFSVQIMDYVVTHYFS